MEYIDRSKWERDDLCRFFGEMKSPFYEMTFPVDVTNLYWYTKEREMSFYFSCVYLAMETVNAIDPFLYKIRGEDIIRHDMLLAGSTDAIPGTDLFHYITADPMPTMEEYCKNAKAISAAQTTFFGPKKCEDDQLVYFTCVPWVPFTSLANVPPDDRDNSVPRITFGKFTEEHERLMMPCSVMVNHRLLDGTHIGRFYENFSEKLSEY